MAKGFSAGFQEKWVAAVVQDTKTFNLLENVNGSTIGEQHSSKIPSNCSPQDIVLVKYLVKNDVNKTATLGEVVKLDMKKNFAYVINNYGDALSVEKLEAIRHVYEEYGYEYNTNLYTDEELSNEGGLVLMRDYNYVTCLEFKDKLAVEIDDDCHTTDSYTEIVELDNPFIDGCFDIFSKLELASDEIANEQVPEWVGSYYIPHNIREILPFINEAVGAQKYLSIMTRGESGSGKTTFAKALAEYMGYNYAEINASMVTDPSAWFGKYGTKKGGITYSILNNFAESLQKGKTVVLIDEFNRVATDLLNPLLPVLDDRHCFEFDNLFYEVAEETIVVLSANIGYGYSGTFAIDTAFKNRRNLTLRFGDLPDSIMPEIIIRRFGFEETKAQKIFNDFAKLRHIMRSAVNSVEVDMSVRTFINIALWIKSGSNMQTSIRLAVLNDLEEDEIPKDCREFMAKLDGGFKSDFNSRYGA